MPVSRTQSRAGLGADFAAALLAAMLALIAAELIHAFLGLTRLGLLFLAAVTVVASIRGSRAAVLAALISVVAYKLFLDFRTIDHTTAAEDLLNMVIFLVVALITGTLAGKVHDAAGQSRRHAKSMEVLFNTSRALGEENERGFWPTLTSATTRVTGFGSIALDAGGGVQASCGTSGDTSAAISLGKRCLLSPEEPACIADDKWQARRIQAEDHVAGVLLWEVPAGTEGTETFVDLLSDLAGASITRSQVRSEQIRLESAEQASKLRDALLSSISHDFRSPLAAIIGSATSLLEYGDKFSREVREDLLFNIRDEGEKLNQFVANLLDMTKLQSGVTQPKRAHVRVEHILQAALERLSRHHGKTPIIKLQADCSVIADPLLLEQAVYNVLDNAMKYAVSDEGVWVTCTNHGTRSEIAIVDHGPGLPMEDHSAVFTDFHFVRKNGHTMGTGLGLSISRGFIEAMGGTITARNRPDEQSGLEIVINMPRSEA